MNRIVWFIRNVDFTKQSLDDDHRHLSAGIAEVDAACPETLSRRTRWPHGTRARTRSSTQGTPEDLARRIAAMPDLVAAPDIVLTAQTTGQARRAISPARISRIEAAFRLGSLIGAAREIAVSDYFDRLALDRAIDSIATPTAT